MVVPTIYQKDEEKLDTKQLDGEPHDITEILLKVVLTTITLTLAPC
jgi:hypothetical protein